MTSIQNTSLTISQQATVNSDEVNNNNNMTNNSNEDLYNHIELDSQLILRMPSMKQENGTCRPHPAALVLKQLLCNRNESELESLKDRLFIEINSETRKGHVKFDNEMFDARLVDLPCIVESLKTKDKKLLIKTADICQMLICKTKDDPWLSDDEGQLKNNNNKESQKVDSQTDKFKKFQWPHGLTPPLKNVRRKRFRKVAKKKVVDYEEIEKEVKHLFRADREAVKVDYEVLYVEGDLDDEENNVSKENANQNEDEYDSSDLDETSKMASFKNSTDKLNESSRPYKSKSMMEESNMSSDIDDDSIMLKSKSKSKRAENFDDTNLNATNFDDFSNDTSNLMNTNDNSSSNKKGNRTNFKNLFVKEVIGDLSSSSNESDEERDDEKSKYTKSSKTKVFNEDSVTNFDDVTSGADNNFDEYEEGEGDDEEETYKDNNEDESISMAFESSKPNENKNTNAHTSNTKKASTNDLLGFDEDDDLDSDEEDDDDEDEEQKKSINDDDENGDNDDKDEIRNQLGTLNEELKRIREDRKKREIEINSINNPGLKAHLTSRLNILIDEESKKLAKIDELKSLLNE